MKDAWVPMNGYDPEGAVINKIRSFGQRLFGLPFYGKRVERKYSEDTRYETSLFTPSLASEALVFVRQVTYSIGKGLATVEGPCQLVVALRDAVLGESSAIV